MAKNIKVGIDVSDNGTTKKATEAAERLKNTYDAAGKSAKSIGVGGQAGGSKTAAGAMNRATTSSELVDYNRQRSVSVGTGASARDFAKQSEGLGGLVRLYATFAANIFAVSAAFGALSSAMDTTNMIRGLDQLGASTGVNLGGLSKRLVETTGNAVSLREAMEATVKASAAGIDSSSILRLGKVAQQASVALGVNAADALNRLSRGVVKLEPELLDELGIFTKIDPAVKKYAESVNKAVGDLTDFEKRQAFLNAVIEEGEQKFSEIEIDTNPYTKLSAALQNTLQNALELVNKGLGPVANFLAESPGALTASLIALGTVLVKQALPALGQVREGLRKTAEEAAEAASGKAGDAVEARGILQDLLVKQVQKATDEQIQLVDESEKRILELKNGRISKQSALYALMKKDIQDVEDADIEAAKKQLAGMGNRTAAQKALRLETENFIRQVEKLREAHDREYAQGKKQLESTYIYRKVQEDALKFEIKAKQDSMISNAAYTSSLLGPTAGWRRLRAEIELADLSLDRFQKTALLARGALAIVGSAIASVADKIGKLFFYIGIVTTAWTALSSLFTSREAQKLNASFDELDSTLENVEKTFKRVKDNFSEVGLTAQANALTEFSKSFRDSIDSAKESLDSLSKSGMYSFASIGNRLADFFSFLPLVSTQQEDIAKNLSSSIVVSLDSAIRKLPSKIGNTLSADILKNLKFNPNELLDLSTPEARQKAIDKLKVNIQALADNNDGGVELSRIMLLVAEAFDKAATASANAASRIRETKEAAKEATNSFNQLVDSYKVKSPVIEFAEKSIVALEKADKAQKEAAALGDPNAANEARKAAADFLESVGLDRELAADTAAGIKYFTEVLTTALRVEKDKAQNAFKDFALSIAPGGGPSGIIKQLNLDINQAEAKLRQFKQEREIITKAETSAGGIKLTPAAKQGLDTKITAANNEILILQTKKQLELEKERLANLNRLSARQKELIDKEKAIVELSFLQGIRSEEELAIAQGKLKIDEISLQYNKKIDELDSKKISTQKIVNALNTAGEEALAQEIEGEQRLTDQAERGRLNAEKALAIKKEQINTDLQLLNIAIKIVQEASALIRINKETARITRESSLSSAESDLNTQIRTNKLSRDQLLSQTESIALRKIEEKQRGSLENAEISFYETQIALAQKLAAADIRGDKAEVERVTEQIKAQNKKYEATVQGINSTAEAEKRSAKLDTVEKRIQLLQNELDLRRQIEDIVRGGTFTAEDTRLNIEEEAIELKRKTLRLDQEIYIAEKGAIALRRNAVDFERQRVAAIQETTRQIQDSENRKNAPGVGQEIIAQETERQIALSKALGDTLANLDQQEDSRERSLRTATALEQIELRNTRADAARTVLDLENQIAQVRISSIEEANSKTLEISRRRNQLGAQEIRAFETGALQTSVASRSKQSLDALNTSKNATRVGLVTELAKAIAAGADQAALDNINERIRLQDELYQNERNRIKDNSEAELQLGLLDIQKRYNDQIKSERDLRAQINAKEVENSNIEKNYDITKEETRLEALKQIRAIEESRYLQLKNSLEIEKLGLDIENRKRSVILSAVKEIQDSQARVSAGGLTPEQVALELDFQNTARAGLALSLSLLNEEGDLRKGLLLTTGKIAEADAKRAEEAKKLTDQYKQMANAAKLIGDVFDGFGDRFAQTIGGLSDVLQTDLEKRNALERKYEEKRLVAAEKYKGDSSKRRLELLKLDKEAADESLALDAEVISKASGSFKSLFKEKTAAYKAFSLVEKAAAVTTFALNAQIIASNLATLASRVSAGVAQLFAQGGFAGFAASAALLALMGSLGFFGSKSVKNTSGPSTEAVQKAQTTGQFYQGNTLTTRRGASSSDPTKTLESIDESLEILKTYGFDELEFSNKNLKALSNIERNTKGLSEALAIFALSLPGNVPIGSKTSGPFSFGGGVLGKGLSLASGALGAFGGFLGGTAGASYLGNLLLDTFGTALTGIASPLTSIITSAFGPVGAALGFLLGKNLDKVLNSVFGGKTTKTLKDVTLTIDGQLNKLAEGNSELIKTFAVLEVKIDGGWFRRDKIFDELFQLETPDLVKEYVGSLFKDIKTGIEVAGAAFGMDVTKVLETSLTDPIKVSLKDLSPEEIAAAIKNQISSTLNELALTSFGSLISALRDPLEEAGTTLTRLTTQVTLFDQAMKLMGKNVDDVTGTLKIVVADRLVELLGGVENFKDKTTFFIENFLSESEQIAPIAQELTKELNSLGISADITREQYKALVLQQDLSTDSGQDTYAALLNLAEAFDKVTSAAEQSQEKLNGFLNSIRDFIRSQSLELIKPSQTTKTLLQEFGDTISKALAGDEDSLSYLPDIASQTIESAKNSSASLREFNKLRAGILGSLSEVANKIESGDLKILTPQEQTNVLLEKIEYNTANFSADLAAEIDKQQEIKNLLANPEELQAAVAEYTAAAVAQEMLDGGWDPSLSLTKGQTDFLDAEAKAQKEYDDIRAFTLASGGGDIGPNGPKDARMSAVESIIALATPLAGFAQVAKGLSEGKSLQESLPALNNITLDALGVKVPSLDAFVEGIKEGAKGIVDSVVELGGKAKNAATIAIAMAGNAALAVDNAIKGMVGSGGDSGTPFDSRNPGTITGYTPGGWDDPDMPDLNDPDRNALGGAFNKGVKMFATGGAFSNSIVNNPTMFPLGVMGEAGPEAIMPLTRMGDGSLGVTAEVPVNNVNQFNLALLQEVKNLKKEMEKVRAATEVSATGTNKTYRLLDRVTENGDALNVVVVTA